MLGAWRITVATRYHGLPSPGAPGKALTSLFLPKNLDPFEGFILVAHMQVRGGSSISKKLLWLLLCKGLVCLMTKLMNVQLATPTQRPTKDLAEIKLKQT